MNWTVPRASRVQNQLCVERWLRIQKLFGYCGTASYLKRWVSELICLGKVFSGLVLAAVLLFAANEPVRACACCPDGGVWEESKQSIVPDFLNSLSKLRLIGKLFVINPENGGAVRYPMHGSLKGNEFTFSLSDIRKVGAGQMVFNLPKEFEKFEVDQRDRSSNYREIRLLGKVITQTVPELDSSTFPARMIIQGSATACEVRYDGWIIQILDHKTRQVRSTIKIYGKVAINEEESEFDLPE